MRNVVYQATVKARGCEDANYVGLTARPFKPRYGEQKGDFKNLGRKNNTSACAGDKGRGKPMRLPGMSFVELPPSTPSHGYAICAPPKNGTLSLNQSQQN